MLQSTASNWIADQLIFVHPVSKGIWKALIKCLLGCFFGMGGNGQERPEPLDTAAGWVEHARPGVQGRAEGVRLVSPGSAEPSELGAPHGGLSRAPGQAAQYSPGAFCNEPATWLDRDL